jgi:hypothetical protein
MAEIDFATVITHVHDVQPDYIFEWCMGNRLDEQGRVIGTFNEFEFKKYTEEEISAIKASIAGAWAMADLERFLQHGLAMNN